MTNREKAMMIVEVIEMLEGGSSADECLDRLMDKCENKTEDTPKIMASKSEVKLLTVKECMKLIDGIKEHTLRQLLLQRKIPSIRCGEGKRGKCLVRREDLIGYFENLHKTA